MMQEQNLFGEIQPVPTYAVTPPRVQCTAGWSWWLPEAEEPNRKRAWLVMASGTVDKAELKHAWDTQDEKMEWLTLEVQHWGIIKKPSWA